MEEPPTKRFRYATYNEKLRDISIDKGRSKGLSWEKEVYDEDTDQTSTPFTVELAHLSIQDLTAPFQQLARSLTPLTTSLPITLLNLPTITSTLSAYYATLVDGQDHVNSGLGSALTLHHALYATCLGEAAPYLAQSTADILRVGALRALEPSLIQKAYTTLSDILRITAPTVLRADPAAREILHTTWTHVTPYLRRENKQYVRKCVADAWIGVIRKARGEALGRLMDVLLEGEAEGMQAVWAGSMKGTAGQLHSRALPILEILLEHALATEQGAALAMLKAVMISIAHHSTATTMAPVASAVLGSLRQAGADRQRSVRALELLSTLMLVRKGKRFPEASLKLAMALLVELSAQLDSAEELKRWREEYLHAVIASLAAGKLEHWLSPGVQLIDQVAKRTDTVEFFAFVNGLVGLKWAGVEQFLLSHIARTTLPALKQHPVSTLSLLNHLASSGYLSGGLTNVQGGKWRRSLLAAVSDLSRTLASDNVSVGARRQVGLVLRLIPALGEHTLFAELLLALLLQVVGVAQRDREELRRDWREAGAWNETHLCAVTLRCVVELAPVCHEVRQGAMEVLMGGGMQAVVTSWGWSREVLQEAATLAEQWSTDARIAELDTSSLLSNLLSADSSLRSGTLRFLAATSETSKGSDGSDESEAATPHSIWSQCLRVESTEMSLRNSRERTEQIARLGRLLLTITSLSTSSELVALAARHAVRYLLAQLKVNYRPLYAESVKALGALARSPGAGYADEIWESVWGELERTDAAEEVAVVDLGEAHPEWATKAGGDKLKKGKEADEEEAEFRCTAMDKVMLVLDKEWAGLSDESALDASEVSGQVSSDRLDVLNYEGQLLALLGAMPLVAEKHTRLLVPMFLAVSGYDAAALADSARPSLSTRQLQNRTANFLELLSKFVNPKAAFRSEELHRVYLDILSKGESRLQKLAVECLLTYKSPALATYGDNLLTLLDESKFRDELVHFSLHGDAIDPSHRSEVVPVTIRLLFGIITARRGRTSAHGLQGRKQAVLTFMAGCTPAELGTLVDLMLHPIRNGEGVGRQQIGFLSLLHDVLRYLGPQMVQHWPALLDATIELVAVAQGKISAEGDTVEEEEAAAAAAADEDVEELSGAVPHRSVRSVGIKRLVEFVKSRVEFDFTPFLPRIMADVVAPRLDKLDVENTQAPSGILDLITALSANEATARFLVDADERTLPKTFACLVAPKVKPAVIGRVFDVVELLLALDDTTILGRHVDCLLGYIIQLVPTLRTQEELMKRLLGILSRLSVIVTNGAQAQTLAGLLGPMLRQSTKQVPEKAKLNILQTLQRLYAISPDFADPSSDFFRHSNDLVSNLFQTLFYPSSRRALVVVLQGFAVDADLADPIRVVGELNAYSARRMDEPDFARRLAGFAEIVDADKPYVSRRQWLPLLRSALFFLRDPEELSIRTNASAVLQKLLSAVGDAREGELAETVLHVVLPGLKAVLRSKLELVRNEALGVLSHAIRVCSGLPPLAEMRPLLGDELDEEQDFFTNMVHIQVHRRTRAIHRLRDLAVERRVPESAAWTVLLPLLEHVVSGATDVSDHHLVNEAITAVGALTGGLRWSRYHATLMRYLRLGAGKSAQQKFYIRTVSAIIDHFGFDLAGAEEVQVEDGDVEERADDEDATVLEADAPTASHAARITEVVLTKVLPALTRFVEQKDETEDNIRIPVALGIVKIAHALPGESSGVEILRIITTVSQILRSKDQDTRDLARETVCKIAVYLGPGWLVSVLKELREALQRGPQKHVLAVTVHAILVQATEDKDKAGRFADLDGAVQDAVEVSAEVVWGESGRDVETDGFKTKMREVKGAASRGFDTFQLVSRLASPGKIATVLAPLKAVMHASQAVKTMNHVDEALRRITLGLNANAQLGPKDLLSLCYSLLSGNSAYLQAKPKPSRKDKKGSGSAAKAAETARYIVQMKRDQAKEEDYYGLNAYRFVAFGLDLFVTAFRRGRFDFDDPDMLARLGPLVNAIGNTLYSTHEPVLALGLKATAAIARCPLPQLEAALPVFVSNVVRIIKLSGGSAESELVQTALKALAVVLRDCKASALTDGQLKYLLEVVSPDLEEADRQAAIFTLLRAIVSRKMVVPEVYDLMDRVSGIMVTSQSTHVQEQCRGALMAFLLDYPQGAGRLKNQMTFLAQNLDYVYESGRVSVMELLSAILGRFATEVVEEYCDLLFVALVMVLANDDSEKCRGMAGLLIKLLLENVGEHSQAKIVRILQGWVGDRRKNGVLGGAALGVVGMLIGSEVDVRGAALEMVPPIVEESAARLGDAEEDEWSIQLDHILPHQALVALGKLVTPSGDDEVEQVGVEDVPLDAVIAHLLFPHDWVRFDAAGVVLALFNREGGVGVFEDRQLLDVARKGCLILKGGRDTDGEETVVDTKLADEVVKLLWKVATHWASKQSEAKVDAEVDAEDDEVADGAVEADAEATTKISAASRDANPLSWLMSRASFLARQLIVNRPSSHIPYLATQWTRPVMSILRFFAGTTQGMDEVLARRYARHVLSPVYRILDEGGEMGAVSAHGHGEEAIAELKQLATEVRDFVQSKIGTTDFSHVWENLRKTTRERREGRRDKKNAMAVADPQAFAARKEKRGEMKKESKKRKVKAFADLKYRERPTKRRG